jgi:DNA repair exonuclease SbcCD nuclease subunit
MFLEKLREYNFTMDIIPGNHDVFYKNTNELCALNELMGHYMDEVRIIPDPTVMDYDGMKMALVPWINPENESECMQFLQTCKADIVGGHFELIGFDMYSGMQCHEGMDPKVLQRFEMVLSGHFHTKSSRGNIHYLGAQMEFFWNDANDAKYFHVLDTNTRELTPIANPLTMFEKIYYDDTRDDNTLDHRMDLPLLDDKFVKVVVLSKGNPAGFDLLLDRIQQYSIHELKIAENFDNFTGTNVEDDSVSVEDTEVLVDTYIDAVDTPLDKDRIKRQVRELMIEAQSSEIA